MKHRRFVLFLLTAALLPFVYVLPAAAQADCDPAIDYVAKAELAATAGNYSAAISAYDCALTIEPDEASILFERALTGILLPELRQQYLIDINNALNVAPELLDDALIRINALVDASPDAIEPLIRRAYLLWRSIDDEGAMLDFEAILAIEPDNIFATLFRGSSNLYLGNMDDAAADFERAIALDPGNAGILSFIGHTYGGTGDSETAIEYFTDAIALEPRNAAHLSARSYEYVLIGDTEAANADMIRALSLNPTDPGLREEIGWNYVNQGSHTEAIRMFTSALVFDPERRFSYLGRGTAMIMLGNTRGGAQDYHAYFILHELSTDEAALEDGSVTLAITDGLVVSIPFEASARDVVTISAVSEDGSVDPVILLLDTNGIPLTGNDDRLSLEDYNSELADLTLTASGTYTLLVTNAGGSDDAGDLVVSVSGLE